MTVNNQGTTYRQGPVTVGNVAVWAGLEALADGGGSFAGARTADIEFIVDGGGSAITVGMKGYLVVDFPCTISQSTLLGDQTGSIVVNIFKCTFAQFDASVTHPVAADKITANAPPTISAATKAQDSTLTGWTTAINAGDILAFNVDSVATVQRATLALKVVKN
jgi:hypothetical protein